MRYSKNLKYNILGACEHPKEVYNKYTGDKVVVPCGTCRTCLLNRLGKYSRLCSIEESNYNYCYFVTLTYSPSFVPLMRLVPYVYDNRTALYNGSTCDDAADDLEIHYKFVGSSPDRPEYNEVLCDVPPDEHFKLASVFKRAKMPYGYLSYLCPSDLQKFLKRLRKNASKISNSKIRYFAVGEYGAKYYRCHWHIILYFDCDRISQNITEIVSKSWKYGLVDCDSSRGQVSSYVSGYVNSFVELPFPLSSKRLRPRNYHSYSFGFKAFEKDKEKIYELGLRYFDEKVHSILGKYSTVQCPDRLRHYLYPRCVGFAGATYEELVNRYSAFKRAREFFPEYSSSDIVNIVSGVILKYYDVSLLSYNSRIFIARIESLLNIPRNCVDVDKYVFSFVYNYLHTSRHFLEFVCDSDPKLFHVRLNQIIDFYNDLDYRKLRDWYSAQEEFGSYCTDYDLFYDTSIDYLHSRKMCNPVYNHVLYENYKRFNKSFKHKQLNDEFDIFGYQ